ncbi:Protein of unknown function (DUF1218) [Abeliophyllum distichum]|uniref:Transmembrane protein n=1 Tax=Abeliophyllum distichum TaxID=126358 RepID=A0ABD1TXM9_9LAMI
MLFLSLIIALGLVSFSLCLAAEFKKSNKKDLRFDGKLCYLPGNPAYGFGIAALICLFAGQVIGNLFICRKFSVRDDTSGCYNKVKRPTISSILLIFSWICFGVAVIPISAATSMSRSQPFGEGWLDGSALVTIRQRGVEEDRKVHAQIE